MSTHLRERIAATLAAHDLPDGTDRDGQWAADALMPLIAAEIGRLEAEIDRADLRADRRAADLRTQNKRIRDLENTIAGRDSRITGLESRLARSRTHRADLTRKNGHLQALADRRWVAYQSARRRAASLRSRIRFYVSAWKRLVRETTRLRDQAHGHYETTTAPTPTEHKE